ncbi:hypothetical protein BBP40_011983 [Aspergillus hancockii]|nr:hypothetical protein BBP40_011983 [Aspergillus hancockii]
MSPRRLHGTQYTNDPAHQRTRPNVDVILLMEAWDLQLTVPSTHILLESYGEVYAPPITGSVVIAVPSSSLEYLADGYLNINISLIRSVTPNTHGVTISKTNKKSHGYLLKRLQKRPPAPSRHCSRAAPRAEPEVETVVQCSLWNSPDQVSHQEEGTKTWLRFSFCIPIPSNIPVTAETILGNVSYTIAATVTPPEAISGSKTLRAERGTNILRCMVSESLEYFRQYPGERVTTELCLTPKTLRPGSLTKAKAAYAAQWVARSTIKPGLRQMEVKYVVVKQLRWRIEEVVKHITISKSCDLQRAPTTTCEDTLDRVTGKLVDRKPRIKAFNAVFPLPIREFVSGDSILLGDNTLPRYEDTYLMPPNYTIAV